MTGPAAMSRRHLAMLLGLAAIWGASFLFIKVGLRGYEPSTLVFFRVLLAALTLLPIAVVAGVLAPLGAAWKGRLFVSSDGVKWKETHKADRHVEAVAFGTVG